MPRGALLLPRLWWPFLELTFAASELSAYVLVRYLVSDTPGWEIHPEHYKPTSQKHPGWQSRFATIPLYLGETTSNQPKRNFQEWRGRRIPFLAIRSLWLLRPPAPETVIVISPLVPVPFLRLSSWWRLRHIFLRRLGLRSIP